MAKNKQKHFSTTRSKAINATGHDRVKLEKEVREICKVIAKVTRINPSKISNDTNLRDDLGLDSLQATEILAVLENKYHIQIDEAKALDIVTAKDLYELVESYLKI